MTRAMGKRAQWETLAQQKFTTEKKNGRIGKDMSLYSDGIFSEGISEE